MGWHSATRQMGEYKPEEHEDEASVAPLVEFFELVHVGDTIGQMIQVFYDKEMVSRLSQAGCTLADLHGRLRTSIEPIS